MSRLAIIPRLLRHPLMFALYVPSVIYAFSYGMMIPILPLYAGDFEISYGLIGLVLAGDGVGMLLADVPAGLLLRRLKVRGVMLLGLGLSALSVTALFWAASVPEVVLCRLLTGFGQALYGVSRHALLTEAVSVGKRGRAIAGFGGVYRVGRLTGPVVAGLVAAAFGLRAPFLVYGGACAIALVLVAFFVRGGQVRLQPEPGERESGGNPLVATLKTQRHKLLTGGAGQLFAQMIRAGWNAIIPLYGADVLGLDVREIGLVVSIMSAIDMSLFLPAGWVMDRLGRKHAIVPSFTIQALGLALVAFATSFLGLLAASMLIGLGNGLGSGTMMTLGADLAPQDNRGAFLGVWRLIGDAGATGGPLVIGGIADLVTLSVAGLVVAGAGLLAATIFARLVPETLKKRPQPAS